MTEEQRLQAITEMLILVRDNLFRGMSKSIQKLQARSINEVLELPNYTESPQQQAEPVAYFDFQEQKFSWAKHMQIGPVPMSFKVEPMKLYSEPPQRQWVGLTDEEILRADPRFVKSESDVNPYQILGSARDLEAKLKERNA
jgi:hypothetical protein